MHRKMIWLALAGALAAQTPSNNPVDASALFARIKNLAGEWEEKSTKGWSGGYKVRVIARGTAVLLESRFDDEPNEGMVTLFYVDKGRLMLTHYCEAKNQPTLAATSADGDTVVFEFVSGTGMKSRDDGHMDKLVMKFTSPDSFLEQWSWYQAGQQKPFEEIACRRIAKH